jgi:protein TonB
MLATVVLLTLAAQAEPLEQSGAAEATTIVTPPSIAGGWFMSDDDYPAEARRQGLEGATSVVLQISAKGRVTDCRVTESSGTPSLDEASCSMLSKVTFKPARDAGGHAVAGEFARRMNWTLPRRR